MQGCPVDGLLEKAADRLCGHCRCHALSKKAFEQAAAASVHLIAQVKANQPALHHAIAALCDTAAPVDSTQTGEGQRHVAIDGKTLRRSFDNFLDRRAAHILSAFASDKALVLGHLDCGKKSNEIPAVQTLLGSLAPDSFMSLMNCAK